MMTFLIQTMMNKEYWEQRYTNQETGWDIGSSSTPLKEYIEQLENKNFKNTYTWCRKWP